MATAPPPQRQSILTERNPAGLTLLDLLEMTPDEIEAHLRGLAPQQVPPEPAILRPAAPEAEPAGLVGAELRPANPPRDILGEAMAEGSPPVPWVAGYAMLAGRPEDEALMWDTAAGHLGQAMTAHVAMPGERPFVAPPARRRGGAGATPTPAPGRKPRGALGLRDLLVSGSKNVDAGPAFYSQAEAVVSDPKTQGTQTGEAWAKFLTDPKRGVKAEEMKWTGLGDYLKSKSGERVTREQILEHLNANQIEVREVTKGAPHEVSWSPDPEFPDEVLHGKAPDAKASRYVVMRERGGPNAGKWTLSDSADARIKGVFDTPEAAQRAATYALGMERSGQPKFSNYTLPGAQNYREVLLTLPQGKKGPDTLQKTADGANWEFSWKTADGKQRSAYLDGGLTEDQAREQASRRINTGEESGYGFRSGHWDEPNVLAHLRLSDRTDADGKRVLLVEEIQSDWAQKGRKEGFADAGSAARRREIKAQMEALAKDRDPRTNQMRDEQAWHALAREREGIDRRQSRSVPEAPFVGDTSKWVNLSLKRVLRMAADEGYDRVGIVRGEEQAARYDLSKQIDNLIWYKVGDSYRIVAEKGGEKLIDKKGLDHGALEDTVGKEMAKKIVEASAGDEQHGVIGGLDLKVGGEGMKSFYDEIVPQALDKLAKEHGVKVQREGGKIGNPKVRKLSEIDADMDALMDSLGDKEWSDEPEFKRKYDALQAERNKAQGGEGEVPIHVLDVPEPMKKSIKTKGFPLYSRQENLGTLMRTA